MKNFRLTNLILVLCFFASVDSQSSDWKVFTTNNSALPSNNINAIEIDRAQHIWIGTDNGLVQIYGEDWIIYNTANSGLPDNDIYALAVDDTNSLWIGTARKGLVQYDHHSWRVFDTSNSPLPANNVISLGIDHQGQLWIGTFAWSNDEVGGVAKYDGKNWSVYDTNNSGLPLNMASAFAFDANNHVWMAIGNRNILTGGGGAVKFDGANWEIYSIANLGLPWDFVYAIVIDSNQNIYFGTMAGLAIFDGQNWTTYNPQTSNLPHSSIPCLALENQATLWIGTDGLWDDGGLVRLHHNEMQVFNKSNSKLPWNRVSAIKISENGDKLIGTWQTAGSSGGGFAIYNEQGVKTDIRNKTIFDPRAFELEQNFPNPFNSITQIRYFLPKADLVTFKIYNQHGQEIRTENFGRVTAGFHYIHFQAKNLSSGLYLYQLITTNHIETRKMLLIQ
ncbi:T9SS type A sorting domain-containing protein [candidate division KSB1 bacterium]|nr:T9SS type A sorting domain-containing protein [candidate division KSB1 bacterium]